MRSRNAPYLAAFVLATLVGAAFLIDIPVARAAKDGLVTGDFRKLLSISEVFAHGFGVALILITVAVMDPISRRKLPRVATCTFGAGLVAQCAKHVLPRTRPYASDLSAEVWASFASVSNHDDAGWIQALHRGLQSFPSGHTATAVGLAIGLSWLYPRGKWLFAIFALLATLQRIESSAHFVSDTFAAAAIACLLAGLCLDERAFGRWFTRFEKRADSQATTTRTHDDGNSFPRVFPGQAGGRRREA